MTQPAEPAHDSLLDVRARPAFVLRRVLLPILLPDVPLRIVQRAAFVARRFRAEVLLLSVLTPMHYPPGLIESGFEIPPGNRALG